MNLDAILWLDFLEVEMLWLLTPNKAKAKTQATPSA